MRREMSTAIDAGLPRLAIINTHIRMLRTLLSTLSQYKPLALLRPTLDCRKIQCVVMPGFCGVVITVSSGECVGMTAFDFETSSQLKMRCPTPSHKACE